MVLGAAEDAPGNYNNVQSWPCSQYENGTRTSYAPPGVTSCLAGIIGKQLYLVDSDLEFYPVFEETIETPVDLMRCAVYAHDYAIIG